ncbi:MAG: hypothetical protein M3235_09390 [Actinomycetota bacterium]|nr:hypothetical protein [Actinomycetota bacterium]
MSRNVLVVLSNPTEGQDAEYNEWYTTKHLDEVVEIPGFVSAQRFRLTDAQLSGFQASSHRYLALYEIEGDVEPALEALHSRVASGEIALPGAIDAASIAPWAFTPITDRTSAE